MNQKDDTLLRPILDVFTPHLPQGGAKKEEGFKVPSGGFRE